MLLLTDFFYPRYGGVAAHVHGLARALKMYYRNYEPLILTSAGRRRMIDLFDGIQVVRYPYQIETTLMFNLERITKRLKYIINSIDPDILHAHHAFTPMGITTPWISKSLEIPAILTNHSIPMGYYVTKWLWYRLGEFLRTYSFLNSLRHYKHVIAVSHVAADFISKFYPGKITIIPNAIFLEEFQLKANRNELGINDDSYIILMVGRASIKKGFELAILSMREVIKSIPNAHLYIIGLTGFQKKIISHMIRILKLEKNVHLLDYLPREKLIKYYKVADLFLHTAYGGESFGIVLLEAMAAGLPIVSTPGDGLKQLIDKSGAGICVGYPSAKLIDKAIQKLINDEELRKRMNRNALKFVKNYSWKRIISDIVKIYKNVL